LTNLVHSGIERFSDLNRRNTWNIKEQFKRTQAASGYQHRSSNYDYNSGYDEDYRYEPDYTQ
jgi:hypothetical protein